MKGARIGIARDFLGADADVDWVIESALESMRKAGATVVDVHYPKWLLDSKEEFYAALRSCQIPANDTRDGKRMALRCRQARSFADTHAPS